jgi:hypothetical protein
MKFKQYLEEKISPKAAWKKATDRLASFEEKAKDRAHLSRMINLRTQKTKDGEKLGAWYEHLNDEGYRDEAEIAYKKWRSIVGGG